MGNTVKQTKVPLTLVLFTGGRDFKDEDHVLEVVYKINEMFERPIIIQGMAKGADMISDKMAEKVGVERVGIPAAWKRYGNGAGPIRNTLMLDLLPAIELTIAFSGGTGTADMIAKSEKRDIPVVSSYDFVNA